MPLLKPSQALYDTHTKMAVLPPCEHYAGNLTLIEKALSRQRSLGPVFDITCDLDDGAPRGNEEGHARDVGALISGPLNTFGRMGVRIHDPQSAFIERDLELVLGACASRIAYITIPKVEHERDVARVRARVHELASRPIPLHVLIETPHGLARVSEIAAEQDVEAVALGLIDFVASHHGALPARAAVSPLQFTHPLVVHAKARLSLAALAHGRVPVHGVTLALKDAAQTESDARTAHESFGFLRQISVHPAQIEPIVSALTPSFAELKEAQEILLEAQARDFAPINFNGRFEDRATYRTHFALLLRARAAGVVFPPDISERLFG